MSHKRLLLVEGVDDLHVIGHILHNYQIPCKQINKREDEHLLNDEIGIKPAGGFPSLLQQFGVYLDDPNMKQIAIVIDADTNIDARWQSVCNAMKLPIRPNLPEPSGTRIILPQTGRELSVGVWIMPDNQQHGILEDFLHNLIPQGDPLFSYAIQCVDGINNNLRRFSDLKLSKAQIHTWLAWQEEPGKPFGSAISAKYLNVKNSNAHLFVQWIQSVFEI